jgi:hypothetical protein
LNVELVEVINSTTYQGGDMVNDINKKHHSHKSTIEQVNNQQETDQLVGKK